MRHVTERGLAFNAQREALVLEVHRDTKNLAVGFGMNIPGLVEGNSITVEEAVNLYLEAAEGYDKSLNIIFPDIELKPHQHDALFAAIWNRGATELAKEDALITAVIRFATVQAEPDQTHPAIRARLKTSRRWCHHHINLIGFSELEGPFNPERRSLEALLFSTGRYLGDIDNLGDLSKPQPTIPFWDKGKHPRNPDGSPKDPPEFIPMPRFVRA